MHACKVATDFGRCMILPKSSHAVTIRYSYSCMISKCDAHVLYPDKCQFYMIEQHIVSNIGRNPKSFWHYVNSHMKTRSGIDSIRRPNGSTATSDQEKVELLNSYFASVFTDENLASFPLLESEVSVPKLEYIIITASIVFDELNKLKTDKSPGPEGWPLCIFKECSEHLSIPLSILFNKSFQSGVLPSEWRIAFVTPIYKKGSQHLASNYRPVSLTSTVVKVMESIIKINVLEHLTSNDLLTSHQFGFLRGHSCTTQLLHVMDILTKSLDQGVPIDVVYMDLQKAFDTVPHKRLLYKIEYYGITGNLLRWIAGFLSNRRQCVVLNGIKSSWQAVKSGVPQGSILGTLLFLIYVNDLPRSISSQVFLFADDTKLIRSISTLADHVQLQTDLDNLTKWCDAWQLNFNATKCKVIHFGRATHSYGGYYLNGILLDSVDCYKDLGILFDTGLKFHQHASEVAMKANRVLACMRRGFINLNESVLLRLYKSMVRPILEYGNVIGDPIMYWINANLRVYNGMRQNLYHL